VNKKGFSLLELTITIIVLAIGLVTLLGVVKYVTINSSKNHVNTVSGWLCEDKLEEELKARYDSGFSALSTGTTTESPVSGFSGYTRETTIGYVDISDLTAIIGGPTDYKRIEVEVNGFGSPTSITVSAVVSDY